MFIKAGSDMNIHYSLIGVKSKFSLKFNVSERCLTTMSNSKSNVQSIVCVFRTHQLGLDARQG